MTGYGPKYLFGGTEPWSRNDWTSSDDRIRGGSSSSKLEVLPGANTARFWGSLDYNTLGAAGFASQRTIGPHVWDLSAYDGLELDIAEADEKLYTIVLKNSLLPSRPDGREQSSLSWQTEFRVAGSGKVILRWKDFRPTYRGKEVDNADHLDLKSIRRLQIMIRSFFGTQSGDFNLSLVHIAAWAADPKGVKDEAI